MENRLLNAEKYTVSEILSFKKKETKSLTELSYDNLFYDQSHFNKDFKELTAVNPKVFFKNVDIEREILWFFI